MRAYNDAGKKWLNDINRLYNFTDFVLIKKMNRRVSHLYFMSLYRARIDRRRKYKMCILPLIRLRTIKSISYP